MFQEIFAIIIILFFLLRLFLQKKKKQIQPNEFILWLIFWLASGIIIIFIKQIDHLVSQLGFSSSGIQLMFYFAIIILFYLIFRTRLQLTKIEKNISKLVEKISIDDKK